MARVAVAEHGFAAVVDQLADDEVQLQVGSCLLGPAAYEATGFGEVRGEQAAAP